MKVEMVLRPCYIGKRKALFHRWIESERDSYSMPPRKIQVIEGLVEFEDGTLGFANINQIKFSDSKHMEYVWDEYCK